MHYMGIDSPTAVYSPTGLQSDGSIVRHLCYSPTALTSVSSIARQLDSFQSDNLIYCQTTNSIYSVTALQSGSSVYIPTSNLMVRQFNGTIVLQLKWEETVRQSDSSVIQSDTSAFHSEKLTRKICCTFKLSDYRTVRLSSCRTIELSGYQAVGLSRTIGQQNCRTIKLSDYAFVGLSSCKTIQLSY